MIEEVIATRYAKGLFEICRRKEDPYQVEVQLTAFQAILEKDKKLFKFLTHPAIGFSNKAQVLFSIFRGLELSGVTKGFILLLVRKKRLVLLSLIARTFKDLLIYKERKLIFKLESAFALEKETIEDLTQKLSNRFQQRVELDIVVNPSLICGAKLCFGDTIYDNSLGGRLNLIRQGLL